MIEKISDIDSLLHTLSLRGSKVLVTTNGVFDLLHIGHVRYLEEAKNMGDILVVLVNSDASVRKNKGPKRPFHTEEDRAELLRALRCVDHVLIFDEETPITMLEKLRPDIHVKGGDYRMDQILERETVERYGGKVILVPKIDTRSTSDIADAIKTTLVS